MPTFAPRRLARHLAAFAIFAALTAYIVAGLWPNPDVQVVYKLSGADMRLIQWFLAHTAHAIVSWENPFFTTAMSFPEGLNLMANASMIGLGIVLTPVTLLFGAAVSVNIVMIGVFAGTATAWYWLLTRKLGLHPIAAIAGGLLCGFSPPMMFTSSWGQIHITTQFMMPIIAWLFVKLAEPERWLRNGLFFGLAVTFQVLVGEEALLFTAFGLCLFSTAYVCLRPAEAKRILPDFARGLGVGALVAIVLLAWPLWFQYFGARHYRIAPSTPDPWRTDVMDYLGIPALTGEFGFHRYGVLGLPLAAIIVAFAVKLRRNAVFMSTLFAFAGLAVLSMGVEIAVGGHSIGVPGPWALVHNLPLFRLVVTERFGIAAAAAAGVLLAFAVDTMVRAPRRLTSIAGLAVAAVGLAMLMPKPFETIVERPVPRFITAGMWRQYVPEGHTLVPLPPPQQASTQALRWSSAALCEFSFPGGYYMGPAPDGKGTIFGTEERWTTTMLNKVGLTGVPEQADRREVFLADLRHWKAALLVLDPGRTNASAVMRTVEAYLGPPTSVDDVWIWDVRSITSENSA